MSNHATPSDHLEHAAPSWAERQGWFRTLLFCLGVPALGLALAVVLQTTTIFHVLKTGSKDLDRCVEISKLYDTSMADTPTVVCIGDSVSVEGLDGSIIKSQLPQDWRVYNAALNGDDLMAAMVMTPKLAKAGAGWVVWVSRPLLQGAPVNDLHPDRAAAYGLAGFSSAWTSELPFGAEGVISAKNRELLHANQARAKLHFRTALMNSVNEGVKNKLKGSSVRKSSPSDWSAPFNMTFSISGERLERHIQTLKEEHDLRMNVAKPDIYSGIIRQLRAGGAKPVMVLAPIHPIIRERGWFDQGASTYRTLASQLATETGGLFLDASDLLNGEDFADGQHPNESGRAKLSAFIGRSIAAASAGGAR
jgi:lysophospholipase L1-like esterase